MVRSTFVRGFPSFLLQLLFPVLDLMLNVFDGIGT
jgi:hypothetical protein